MTEEDDTPQSFKRYSQNNLKPPSESWFIRYWRPAMAWQYFAVCVFDFLAAPIMNAWYSWFAKVPYSIWKPISLAEGGYYHMTMLVVLGVYAYTRGQEKVKQIDAEVQTQILSREEMIEETRMRLRNKNK